MDIFVPTAGNKRLPISEAVEWLTNGAIRDGHYCAETVINLRDACKVLLERKQQVETRAKRLATILIQEGVRTEPAVELMGYLDKST